MTLCIAVIGTSDQSCWPKLVKFLLWMYGVTISYRIYATSRNTCGGRQLNYETRIMGFWLMLRCLRKVPGVRGEEFLRTTTFSQVQQ